MSIYLWPFLSPWIHPISWSVLHQVTWSRSIAAWQKWFSLLPDRLWLRALVEFLAKISWRRKRGARVLPGNGALFWLWGLVGPGGKRFRLTMERKWTLSHAELPPQGEQKSTSEPPPKSLDFAGGPNCCQLTFTFHSQDTLKVYSLRLGRMMQWWNLPESSKSVKFEPLNQ